MIVRATDQTKHEFCVAVFNRMLDDNQICPYNHSVDYNCGWFYFDDDPPQQRPELTAEADKLMRSGSHYVGYWREANTYVLLNGLMKPERSDIGSDF